ncbi:MAG: hypothetical protein P4L83_05445 [Nevskia sp.]|nr:hypothetical protein [Nevskia sp.]
MNRLLSVPRCLAPFLVGIVGATTLQAKATDPQLAAAKAHAAQAHADFLAAERAQVLCTATREYRFFAAAVNLQRASVTRELADAAEQLGSLPDDKMKEMADSGARAQATISENWPVYLSLGGTASAPKDVTPPENPCAAQIDVVTSTNAAAKSADDTVAQLAQLADGSEQSPKNGKQIAGARREIENALRLATTAASRATDSAVDALQAAQDANSRKKAKNNLTYAQAAAVAAAVTAVYARIADGDEAIEGINRLAVLAGYRYLEASRFDAAIEKAVPTTDAVTALRGERADARRAALWLEAPPGSRTPLIVGAEGTRP